MGIKTEERLEAVAAGFPPGPYGGTIPPYHTTKKWIFHPLIFTILLFHGYLPAVPFTFTPLKTSASATL